MPIKFIKVILTGVFICLMVLIIIKPSKINIIGNINTEKIILNGKESKNYKNSKNSKNSKIDKT